MELKIEYVDIDSIKPYKNNAKLHPQEQIEQIKKSIEQFGMDDPIGIWKDEIVEGHGRLIACKELGYTEVPIIRLDHLTDEERKAYTLAHNKLTMNSDFDLDILQEELDNFDTIDMSDFGFDIDLDIEEEQKIIEDEVPEVSEEPKAKLGDIYQLGNHRLMCGDSTSEEDVAKLMNGVKADMVFTDPPYNADYSSRVDKDRRKPWGGILNDNMSHEAFDDFLIDLNSTIYTNIKDGASVYECMDWKHYSQLEKCFKEAFNQKSMIVWNKNYFGLGTYYRTKHELILFGVRGDKLNIWNANHDEMDVWDEDREKVSNYEHPTQKPVNIPARAIKNSSNEENIILDIFGGSGSTLIACEQLNRKCYMMELDQHYIDVIIQRWENFTGEKAVLLNREEEE